MQIHTYTIEKDGKKKFYLSLIGPEEIQKIGLSPQNVIVSMEEFIQQPTAEHVKLNPAFVKLFHESISRYCPADAQFIKEAESLGTGVLMVFDQRSNKENRLEEDIIGAFEVIEGKISPDTYKLNAKYRLIGQKGLFKLPQTFYQHLLMEISSVV